MSAVHYAADGEGVRAFYGETHREAYDKALAWMKVPRNRNYFRPAPPESVEKRRRGVGWLRSS